MTANVHGQRCAKPQSRMTKYVGGVRQSVLPADSHRSHGSFHAAHATDCRAHASMERHVGSRHPLRSTDTMRGSGHGDHRSTVHPSHAGMEDATLGISTLRPLRTQGNSRDQEFAVNGLIEAACHRVASRFSEPGTLWHTRPLSPKYLTTFGHRRLAQTFTARIHADEGTSVKCLRCANQSFWFAAFCVHLHGENRLLPNAFLDNAIECVRGKRHGLAASPSRGEKRTVGLVWFQVEGDGPRTVMTDSPVEQPTSFVGTVVRQILLQAAGGIGIGLDCKYIEPATEHEYRPLTHVGPDIGCRSRTDIKYYI